MLAIQSREISMAGVMTEKKLAKAIAAGLGAGRDERYQSWIRIRRNLHSPVSNLYSLGVPLYERQLQLLSGLEYGAANVALWLGAREVREQHPLWPDAHDHPAKGRHPDLDRRLGQVPGLLDLAKQAGIDHGVYPGTRIPFVATIDFTLSIPPWHTPPLIHWSCKPKELLDSAPNRARMHERIQLEQLYSAAVGAKHVLVDGTRFTSTLVANLDWLRPLRSELQILCTTRLKDFGGRLMDIAENYSLAHAVDRAGGLVGLSVDQANRYFRAATWLGIVDVDLASDIVMSKPLKRDLKGLKQRLQRELLGDAI